MIHILTPTDGRPEAFALLERWIGEQDFPDGFRWIVGTRDESAYTFNLGQVRVERPDTQERHPLCSNLLACLYAMEMEPGDLACVVEDDDVYFPGYLSRIARIAEGVSLAGESHARYYNVATRRYAQMANGSHCSLAQTAFRHDVVPLLRAICERGQPNIDLALWRTWTGSKRLWPTECHVGIKGMPGEAGIGMGHRASFGRPDTSRTVFRQWAIPPEYESFAWTKAAD